VTCVLCVCFFCGRVGLFVCNVHVFLWFVCVCGVCVRSLCVFVVCVYVVCVCGRCVFL